MECANGVDVLMVWHSYMLNPRNYFADCVRYRKMDLWATGMPWEAVAEAIDNETFEYSPTEAAEDHFTKRAGGFAWKNVHDSPFAAIACPICQQSFPAPWTTYDDKTLWEGPEVTEGGTGYADKDFEIRCVSCGFLIQHEILRVQKFRKDVEERMIRTVPMPGTFLNNKGQSVVLEEHC